MTDRAPWLGRDTLGPLTPVDDGRSDAPVAAGVHDLGAEAQAALEQARVSRHGKGTRVLWAGPHQRVVLIAMTAGAALGDHKSPPAASFQVIMGSARLYADEPTPAGTRPEWIVDEGGLVPIPPERHGVEARTDCVILLTVSLEPHGEL